MLATGGNHEAGLRPDSVAVPSLRFVNLHAEKNAEEADDEDLQLLAVGDSNLVFLSMDGRVRASIGLTQQPVGTPTLGDFNDDGVLDVIVVSSGGYFSFALERRPNVGGALFAALIAILLVVANSVLLYPINSRAPNATSLESMLCEGKCRSSPSLDAR